MSVIMNEIEKRQIALASYEMKVEKAEKMRAELEQLDKEIAETNINTLNEEIEELTEDAIKLGYIEAEVVEDEVSEDDVSPTSNAERVANVFSV